MVEVRVVPSARGGGEEDLRAKAETWAKALLGGTAKANARDADEGIGGSSIIDRLAD